MIVSFLSILAIIVAIVIGNFRHLNIGLISIMFAFLIGYFMADISAVEIVSGWPLNLFFMLLGIMLLFGIARVNGTLSLFTQKIVNATLGKTKLIPIVFFLMSGVFAAMGAGNIAVCSLVLPIAMAVAEDHRISPILMATMVIAGSNAGGLSPIAPTGIIGASLSAEQGLNISFMSIFYKQIIGQSILACILYLFFKGYSLKDNSSRKTISSETFNHAQILTSVVFLLVMIAIIFGRWDIGLTAFTGSVILLFFGAADGNSAIESIPWQPIILVCGVSVLVNVSETVGGIELLSQYFTKLMNAQTAAPIMAVIGGTLSLVASASGVVMPTLIPTVPDLVIETNGDPTQITSAIIMGAHMVTNSPISTLGALAVASAGENVNKVELFNRLFLIGIAGIFYAALIVYLGVV